MGPKTVIRLVILIAIVVVASLSIYFLQRSQVTRMAKSVLEEAQEAEKGGEYEAAIPEISRTPASRARRRCHEGETGRRAAEGRQGFRKQAQLADLYVEILSGTPSGPISAAGWRNCPSSDPNSRKRD